MAISRDLRKERDYRQANATIGSARVRGPSRVEWSGQPAVEIVRRAQRGDERAFSVLVQTYRTPVFNYVLRVVGDRALAEDLTQEVFLRVFRGLPRFSFRSKFSSWLFQLAKNRVLDELRASQRRLRAVVDLDDVPPVEVADAPFERRETVAAMWQAIEGLPADLKMPLLLRDLVGLSYAEIADILEITLSTVKWRIFKARERVVIALDGTSIADAPSSTDHSETGARRAAVTGEYLGDCRVIPDSTPGRSMCTQS
jgi:RNA polymerase sigma-70 factor (ECF subfamily)